MKNALVTGGTGFIGSHTAVELIKAGYDVTIADNLSNSDVDVLEGIQRITGITPEFHEIDLTDGDALRNLFAVIRPPDFVIHFAASKAVGESVALPLKYYRNNLYSLINLIEVMNLNKAFKLVFSSSSTVYGQADELPVKETTALKPAQSPYGNTKRISEEIIEDFCKANKHFQAISLRYFNPVGADPSALIGELPKGTPNNLIPFLTQTVAGIRKKLSVFGNDYNTPDGTAVRDYIHVSDLANAHLKACSRLEEKRDTNYEVFNIGTGKGVSVLEVLESFEKVNKIKVPYAIAERRAGDVEAIYADASLANSTLKWQPTRNLDEMMSTAWRWQQNLTSKLLTKHT
jgi:UDP-glucose 4-epimerase